MSLAATAPVANASDVADLQYATRAEDALVGLGGAWMLTGLFLDGWAHRNQKPETFFSPWHAILYSGFVASAVLLLYVVRRNQVPGQSWRTTLPVGYGLRALGVAVFGGGAIFDLIWHQVFGIEVNIEALLSPSHLVLLTGGLLMGAGPLISTLHREGDQQVASWRSTGPIVGTVTFALSLIQFFLMYLSPYDAGMYDTSTFRNARNVSGWLVNNLIINGLGGIIVFSLTSCAALAFLLRQIKMPIGGLAVFFIVPAALQSLLVSFASATQVLGAVVAGVIAEVTWRFVKTRSGVVIAAWVGALFTIQWFVFFGAIAAGDGIGWSVHLWTGAPVLAGMLTAMLTLLMNRPEKLPKSSSESIGEPNIDA
jgi:hypothetical protein